ncbi:MAG: AsmA family protein, partial [Pseudomonadota bacterium]|nr:AsmA family protein [Pseudomonadota bacterium]
MRLKAVLQVFVLVIAMALVAGTVFLHLQDYSRIKGLIEQAIMDASGHRLVIHGNLTLSLSLAPELEVKDVKLANTSWGSQPQMVTIGQLTVRLKLLPLLRGDVEFKDINLVDTRILLETDASGRANWHFTPANTARADLAIRNLGIKRLGINQLVVTYRSGEAGAAEEHYTLEQLELSNTQDRN